MGQSVQSFQFPTTQEKNTEGSIAQCTHSCCLLFTGLTDEWGGGFYNQNDEIGGGEGSYENKHPPKRAHNTKVSYLKS